MSDLFYRAILELDKNSFNVYQQIKHYAEDLYIELDLKQVQSKKDWYMYYVNKVESLNIDEINKHIYPDI